jgi:hypothetical protein
MGAGGTWQPCHIAPFTLLCIRVRVSCRTSNTAGQGTGISTPYYSLPLAGPSCMNVMWAQLMELEIVA